MADAMLLRLFRDEVANHLAAIEAGFEDLDDPETSILEAIARAAHSIKGAARIVDVTPAVRVAAAIESLFDGVLTETCRVSRADIPVLAGGLATLRAIAALSDEQLSAGAKTIVVEPVVTSIAALQARPIKGATTGGIPVQPDFVPAVQSLARLDATLIDLFRIEADTHGEAMQRGLLILEQEPTRPDALQALMRAAHSIKGAARVVNVDVAVALAHVMEDCFVSAQAGTTLLHPGDLDVLLQATDTLLEIAANTATIEAWSAEHAGRVSSLAQSIEAIHRRGPTQAPAVNPPRRVTSAPITPAEAPAPGGGVQHSTRLTTILGTMSDSFAEMGASGARGAAPASGGPPALAPVERVVRVATSTVDLMMNLAGESLVETRRFEPLVKAMHKLSQRQAQVTDLLADARFSLDDSSGGRERTAHLIDTARAQALEARRQTVEMMAELDAYSRRAEDLTGRMYRAAISTRMRPFADGTNAFPRLVRDLSRKLDKPVDLVIAGESVGVDRDILERLEAPLNHLLRNALDHGLESAADRAKAGKRERGTLRIEARHWAGMLTVTVSDDGRGIDPARVRRRIAQRKLLSESVADGLSDGEALDYLFAPGFSTSDTVTEISGRGVGLDVVRSVVEEVGGSVRIASEIGKGTAFHLQLPITLSVIRAVVVEIAGEPYAFPMMRIDRIVEISHAAIQTLEGQQYFVHEGKNIGLVPGHQVLDLPATPTSASKLPVVILSDRAHACGVAVDRLLGEHDLVIRPLDPRLGKIADISAAAVLTDGTPLLIIDVEDMVRSIVRMLQKGLLGGVARAPVSTPTAARKLRVLVVDDSITVREVQRQLLGNRGYDVTVAVDGIDGWHAVRDGEFDLVITDVDMPRMNGIDLVKSVKRDPRLKSIPIMIVSYRDREEDKQRGLEAGADYYFTKSDFHDDALVRAVSDLIGAPG